jgi:predicted Zn-dependent peptidase
MKAIDQVTAKQVQQVARDLFHARKMVISVLGPMKQSPAAIKKAAKF